MTSSDDYVLRVKPEFHDSRTETSAESSRPKRAPQFMTGDTARTSVHDCQICAPQSISAAHTSVHDCW